MARFAPGRQKTGGRKPGSKNKGPSKVFNKQLALAMVEEQNRQRFRELFSEVEDLPPLDPLRVLQRCMRVSLLVGDRHGAASAALGLMPYVYPRLTSSEVTVKNTMAGKSTEQLWAELRELDRLMPIPPSSGRLIEAEPEPAPAELEKIAD